MNCSLLNQERDKGYRCGSTDCTACNEFFTLKETRQLVTSDSLADYAHETWSKWMKHLFSFSTKKEDGSVVIPAESVARWERQMNTQYAELPESEKLSDREEAKKMIAIMDRSNS